MARCYHALQGAVGRTLTNIYKIYAESFRGAAHLDALVSEAQELVDAALGGRA